MTQKEFYKSMPWLRARQAFISSRILIDEGCVSEYKNGENQYGTKKSPEIEIYLNMSKNYAAIIKQLTELVPAAKRKNSKLAELKKKK